MLVIIVGRGSGSRARRHSRLLLLAALLLVAPLLMPSSAAADWATFGRDLGNSRSAGADGPSAAEAAVMQQAWVFSSSHGDFTGTPVVADGTLVAGTNLGTIYGLDPATGKQRWSRDVGQPVNGSAAIDPNAPGGPTVFVPIAQIDSPRLIALRLSSGAVLWDTTLTRQSGADVFGSPVYWEGTVYLGTSGPGNDESTARGSVVALNEATGRVRWQTYTVPPGHDGGGVWSSPAIDPATGRLFVGTGNAYHSPAADTTDSIMALDASSGRILGHFQSTSGDVWELSAPANGPDYDFGASPNLITTSAGRQLVGEGQKSGIYWALDRTTMQPVWHANVGPGSQADGGIGSTAYDERRIYGSDSINAGVFALDHGGSMLWSSSDTGTLHITPVAVGNGVLYSATSDGFLVARDEATGAVLNRLSLNGPTFGGISIVGHAVFVSVGTGPPSPILPLPSSSTSQSDGNGSIVAFGDPSAGVGPNDFALKFSSQIPASPTGATLHAVVHRSSPNAKPSGLRHEVLDLPPGARFNGSAVPACAASDQEIKQQGPSACPATSQVGSGTLQVDMGTPADPETADVSIFNWGKGTIEVVTAPGTNTTLAIDRGDFTGPGELTNHPPTAPGGPPDFETDVSQADFVYSNRVGPGGTGFITTPARCPSNGVWVSRISYSTADGRSYSATSTTPCGRTRSRHNRSRRPRIPLTVSPDRIAANRAAVLHIRVTSAARSCTRGVSIRLRGQRTRTNRAGRARLEVPGWPPGRYRLTASKHGCLAAHRELYVVRERAVPEDPRFAG